MCKYHIAVYHCGHEVSFAHQICPFPHIDAETRDTSGSSTSGSTSNSSTSSSLSASLQAASTPATSSSSPLASPASPPLTKHYTHLAQRCSAACPYIRPPAAFLATRAGRDADGAWLRDGQTGRVLGPAARIDPAISTAPHGCALKMGVGRGAAVGESAARWGHGGREGHVVFVYGVCAVCDSGFERRVAGDKRMEGERGAGSGIGDEERARLEMEGFRRGRLGVLRWN